MGPPAGHVGSKMSFKKVKAMISGIREMDMEVCVALGMIDKNQAQELKDAGLTAYNDNWTPRASFAPMSSPRGRTTSDCKHYPTSRMAMWLIHSVMSRFAQH